MCGIITAISRQPSTTVELIQEAYKSQYSRGSDGFGFVSVDKSGKIHAHKRCTTIEGAHKLLARFPGDIIMFHHRYPTSTPNVSESNHPIKVSHKSLKYDYYVIHNGVISNSTERKSAHSALGFYYNTEIANGFQTKSGKWYYTGDSEHNDSESLAVDIALYIEGVLSTVSSRGASAYVVMQVQKKTHKLRRLYYGRNYGNPLYVVRKQGKILVSSQNVTGKGESVPVDILHGLNSKGVLVETRTLEIPTYTTNVGYGYAGTWSGYEQKKLPETTVEDTENDKQSELEDEADSIEEYIAIAQDYLREYPDDIPAKDELKVYTERLKELESQILALETQRV